MIYNTENPPEKKKNIIFCPINSVWAAFILKICLNIIAFVLNLNFGSKDLYEKYPIYSISLIIEYIGTLVASIFITISFRKRKYCFYITGLIIIILLVILMIAILLLATTYKFDDLFFFNVLNILLLAVEWSVIIVLFIYKNEIKLYFSDSDSNNNNNLDNELSVDIHSQT